MIGIIRARLDTEPNAAVWSDQQWQTLMDPTVPYSLAHYWRTCSFGLADLTYRLIPPVTITDPQPSMTAVQRAADPKFRTTRVQAITKVVQDQFKPDWGAFSTLMIWVASPLDLWGSSAFDHGQGRGGVMMCDIASKFDQLCHELGHTLGFDHPYGREGFEYNSSYDIMGGYSSEWDRPPPNGLPTGRAADGTDPLIKVGPMISAAQISTSRYRARIPGLFVDLPPGVQAATADVTLRALDSAAFVGGQTSGAVAAIVPPDPVTPEYHYVIELRRAQGYDAGLRTPARPNAPRPGVVVHGYSSSRRRFFFAGVLALSDNLGDQDLHVFSGLPGSDFTLRLLEVGPDDAWVRIRVGGPNYWRNFGVDVDIRASLGNPEYTDWQAVEIKPCFFAPTGTHSYRYRAASTTYAVDALSFGYEAPTYVWRLDGTTLHEPAGSITVDVPTSVPDPVQGWESSTQAIVFDYSLSGGHLEIAEPAGDPASRGKYTVLLDVTVGESSPGVLKNNYPDRSVATTLRYDAVEIEWDADYKDKLTYCQGVIDEVDRKRIPLPIPHRPLVRPEDRPDDDLPSVLDMVAAIVDVNPVLANALIAEVGRAANISALDVIARLQAGR